MAATAPSDRPGVAFMRRALRLARRGLGYVEPNPLVGCVLVRDGQVIGEGWHRRFGGAHAEVEALEHCRRSGCNPAGCEVYVTLEPCCHQGKTAPCTDSLIAARVRRVVAAMGDPFTEVAGRGFAALRDVGIEVEVGLCEAQARALNAPFLKRQTTGLPWVIAKWAQTLDGKIAPPPPEVPPEVSPEQPTPARPLQRPASVNNDHPPTAASRVHWISNTRSRRLVHRLRARVDAVIVGVGTVVADDPLLTARQVPVRRRARCVIVDPTLRIPEHCRLLRSLAERGGEATVTVAVHADTAAQQARRIAELKVLGVETVVLPRRRDEGSEALDLEVLLKHLATVHAATNVLVEGGARLLGHLFNQRLVDEVQAFIAPCVAGDDRAVPAVTGLICGKIGDGCRLKLRSIRRLGSDVLARYRVQSEPHP